MKLIGILGGTSWPSTVLPYRMLNEEVQRRLGAAHSARIALYSIDYAEIRGHYSGDWGRIPPLLLAEIRTLLSFKPDCWMIANNTLHHVLAGIIHELPADPPLFHAIELVRDHLVARGYRKVLLLGTRFTMEHGYYADPIRAAGIEVVTPDESDRVRVGAIQSQLADGTIEPDFAPWFADLIARHAGQGCEAVIAGCTELPLVIAQETSPIEVVDPLQLQCHACVDFALG
ncbi:amino acid racemase [Altererythrobacter sp. KTW20L]|uniref:aspartate/glutamate racemase family protein n=1 Tax=Altererythrobacter sp. KTW20L TaxID=2942210 RepID=UPI0020BDC04F|nr:amino acid racemase [Altererythrobacter sp. KTW20L]MCL6250072.1 amino acid racemase [Altererythrobacter sp. KTW20L]